jgi:hypothetical protein
MANLPMAAITDGNEKPIDSIRLGATCHHCHPFSKSKRIPTPRGFHIWLAMVATPVMRSIQRVLRTSI